MQRGCVIYGKFVRRFALPTEVDSAKVQAEFKDGVLSVHLPKTALAKPQAIEVKVAQPKQRRIGAPSETPRPCSPVERRIAS
jgi:Hsp20/alpha crystallin family